MRLKQILCATVVLLLLFTISLDVYAYVKLNIDNRDPFEQPILIRATCHTANEGAITSSGQEVRPGIIAGKKEWEGCVAFLYTYRIENGEAVPDELIGMYEVLDTGAGIDTDGDGNGDSIIKGHSIDVFQPTLHQAEEWVDQYGDYVMVMLVRGEG